MILMVVALPSEAKPLCKRYGLKLRCERPFKVFENERIALIQSGVGVESSATAVGYLGALFGNDTRNAWFNIGIAGHRDLKVGSLVMAHKVSRNGDDRNWFPDFTTKPPFSTVEVVSFSKTVDNFTNDYVCDMESAGFMAATEKLSPPHLTHIIKIISDNEKSGVSLIDRKFVSTLLMQSLEEIDLAINCVREHCYDATAGEIFTAQELIEKNWRFTVTQSQQLAREMRRLSNLTDSKGLELKNFNKCRSAQEVIKAIREMADTNAPGLDL